MLKITDIIDFISSKRPQYKMENWENINKEIFPIKDENGELLGFYNDENLKEGLWSNGREFFKKNFFKNGKILKNEKNGFEIYYDDKYIPYYLDFTYFFKPFIDNSGNELGYFNDNGKKEGIWEYYRENGKLFHRGNYVNGEKDGYREFYHENGKLESKGNYKNDIINGYWEFYWDNNNLKSKGNFLNGKQKGIWENYDYEGNDTDIEIY